MTRPINAEAMEQEQRIKEAFMGVNSGRFKSKRDAAKQLGIPQATLYHRAAGRLTRTQAHEDMQILSAEEEKELAHWIRRLTEGAYPPKYYTVREMAETIRTRRVLEINTHSITHVSYNSIGEQWVKRFMTRHPDLESIMAETIESVRIKETSHAILTKWFDNVKSLIDKYNIHPRNIYNMDETGSSIGSIKATCVIIDKSVRSRYSAQPGRQEWVSVIECISMDGSALLPMVIFKGKTLSGAWLSENVPTDWFFSVNSEGWTSNEHTKKWLKDNFEPYTSEKAAGDPRLLIFDGHGSHTTADVVRHCILNRIHLALLPPHSSHLTQPLDIGVFSSLKAHMTHEMDGYIRTGIPRLQKVEWLHAFVVARAQAFTYRNVWSGWAGTGLNPFNPDKVLSRVPNPLPSTPPLRQPTPEYDHSLNNPELNSSPTDTPALRSANTEIIERARDRQAIFDTPARSHVIRLVSTLNRSLARNRITETQFSELEQIITTRKHRQSGKHAILRGETIIATPEMLQRIEETEAATKSRRAKKRKVTHPSTPTPQIIAPSTPEDPLGSASDEDILDCIVVAPRR